MSILYISHKLHEIKALGDGATILRGGKVVGTCDPKVETARGMAQLMIGAECAHADAPGWHDAGQGAAGGRASGPAVGRGARRRPEADRLRGPGRRDPGIAGVAGNRPERADAGAERRAHRDAGDRDPHRRQAGGWGSARRSGALGLCCVPEERNGHAAVLEMSLADNAVLSGYRRMGFLAGGFIRAAKARAFASKVVKEFDVRTPGIDTLARSSLSACTRQKFVVGRGCCRPPMLVVSQPTWGVDVGAAAAIHQALITLAANGAAVLVVSQDLDELLMLTDRLAVINAGVLSEPMPTASASIEEIKLLMGGAHGMHRRRDACAGASPMSLKIEPQAAAWAAAWATRGSPSTAALAASPLPWGTFVMADELNNSVIVWKNCRIRTHRNRPQTP